MCVLHLNILVNNNVLVLCRFHRLKAAMSTHSDVMCEVEICDSSIVEVVDNEFNDIGGVTYDHYEVGVGDDDQYEEIIENDDSQGLMLQNIDDGTCEIIQYCIFQFHSVVDSFLIEICFNFLLDLTQKKLYYIPSLTCRVMKKSWMHREIRCVCMVMCLPWAMKYLLSRRRVRQSK